jgi:hypothetical protein
VGVIDIPDPSACGCCGIGDYGHAGRWTEEHGSHQWQRPIDAQILLRMRARRTRRLEKIMTKKTYTMTMVCTDGVNLGDNVFDAVDDRAALSAALGVAKGYSRHNGDVTWTLKDAAGKDVR